MINLNNSEINLDELMEKIREEIAIRNSKSSSVDSRFNNYVAANGTNIINMSYIEALLRNAESRAYVRSKLPDKFNQIPLNIGNKLGKFILKIFNFIFKDQREVNYNLIQSLRESLTINKQLSEQVELLKKQIEERLVPMESSLQSTKQYLDEGIHLQPLSARIDNTDNNFQQISKRLNDIDIEIDSNIQNINIQLNDISSEIQNIYLRFDEKDSSFKQIRQRISAIENSIYELSNSFKSLDKRYQQMNEFYLKNDSYLKSDLVIQKRLITNFLEEARKSLGKNFSQETLRSFVNEEKHLMDAFYVAFEDKFRGTQDDIKNRLKVYLPLLEKAQLGTIETPILDVGCGRGEWLELLRENGYIAKGLDINKVMLEQCATKGLEVIEKDVTSYLSCLDDNSLGAITGFHIIEHLAFESLIKLFAETVRVLKPNGLVIFETPNPENIVVGSNTFYIDPTHRNPLPSAQIKFIAESVGLRQVEIMRLHPCDETLRFHGSELAERLSEYFYGAQDYAVIGYKNG